MAATAASLAGVEKWPSGADSKPAGHILETWMHAQLAALAELAETPAELHFYRTHSQDEVDFVLARSGEEAILMLPLSVQPTACSPCLSSR